MVLSVASENGCIDTTYQIIRVEDHIIIYAPNTFIPDGNGLNDVWQPIISGGIYPDSYSLQIFNRWGEIVFETMDYSTGWDGMHNGMKVQDGTFTYKIKVKSTATMLNEIIVGHINLLR